MSAWRTHPWFHHTHRKHKNALRLRTSSVRCVLASQQQAGGTTLQQALAHEVRRHAAASPDTWYSYDAVHAVRFGSDVVLTEWDVADVTPWDVYSRLWAEVVSRRASGGGAVPPRPWTRRCLTASAASNEWLCASKCGGWSLDLDDHGGATRRDVEHITRCLTAPR